MRQGTSTSRQERVSRSASQTTATPSIAVDPAWKSTCAWQREPRAGSRHGIATAAQAVTLGDTLYYGYAWFFRAFGLAVAVYDGFGMAWLFFIDESGHDHRNTPYEVRIIGRQS